MAVNLAAELVRISELDEIERAHAYEDLMYDASSLVEQGQIEAALPILGVLAELDPYDDLLQAVVEPAITYLEALGRRSPIPLSDIEHDLLQRFHTLADDKKYVAVATSLFRSYEHKRRDALMLALVYVDKLPEAARNPKVGALAAQIHKALAQPIGVESVRIGDSC
ncbi:hypothetical protein ACLPHM_15375 [Paenalcaligenes sp. Me131]|uniref:hypothetical protein n=1 Tax=Paenalcaligenes sp. Me131 TaxID=3392636 RepID=UPI003D2D2563